MFFRLLPAFSISLALSLALGGNVFGQAQTPPLKLDAITQDFELWQDAQGYLWQLSRAGELGSAEASYFHAALALFVKGVPFAPSGGSRPDGGQATDSGAQVLLNQVMGTVKVTRDVFFDRARGGVRVLDVFENSGPQRESIRVELKTAYQNAWQDLHGSQGRILGATSATGELGERDFGVVVKFSPSEGRQDTLFITGSESDALRPAVSFSANLRELVFSYDLEVEPGKRAALVHWIAQRNLQTPGAAADALKPFYQRRQLIDPRVPAEVAALVRNFDAQSFPSEADRPVSVDGLAALNAVLEPLGVARRGDDLLWIGGDNQLAGTANPAATVSVRTAHGERKASLAEIAAIQGGAGVGRTPRVFLRDGRAWAGPVTATGLSMKNAEGWSVDDLRTEDLSLLLLRVGKGDGKAPEGAAAFIETRAGDVLAVSGESAAAAKLTCLTPWGALETPLAEVAGLAYVSGPAAPRFRLFRRDGSALTAFFGAADLSVTEAIKSAEVLALSPMAIASVWRAGAKPSLAAARDLTDEWYDLDDARRALGAAFPDPAVLLAGNNVLRASLAMDSLSLVSGAAVTPVTPAEVTAIRQSIDSEPGAAAVFEVELAGGQTLSGQLRETKLVFREGEAKSWSVPVAHFVAYARKQATPVPAPEPAKAKPQP